MKEGSMKRTAELVVDDQHAYIAVDDEVDFPLGHPARLPTRRRSYRILSSGGIIFAPEKGWPEVEITGDRSIALALLFGLQRDGLTGRLAGLRGEDL